VGDLGSSASKFFYRVGQGSVHPLWMGAEVATEVSQTLLSLMGVGGGGRPQDSAWLQMGDEVVLVGEAAKALLERNSMRAHKAELAVYKMAAALGVVAELEELPQGFEVVFWLALPLTELGTREAIRTQVESLGQSGFTFRGKPVQCEVKVKVYPEGFGLYLNRKGQLDKLGQAINQRNTLVVMMGHRNLSVLRFEGGSLKAAGSNSNGPGFWPIFERSACASGVTEPDYVSLMSAISTGQPEKVSVACARVVDFSPAMAACLDSYWQAVTTYWQDQVMPQLAAPNTDVIISGGAAQVVRSRIEAHFAELGLSERMVFADGSQERLEQWVSALPESTYQPSITLRMTDSYGLFRGLLGTLDPVTA